ncbi:MAG: helix-turn-helix transcriptional regulator [Rikenellaceae bacterium]
MKEKIIQLMKSEGLTSSRLAEILEIQPSGISHLVSGRNKPGFDLLQKILRRFPKINPYWLMLDDEQMYLPEEVDEPSLPSTPTVDQEPMESSEGDLSSMQNPAPIHANLPQEDVVVSKRSSSIIDFSEPRVKRVIVLYEDGSCETYTTK